MTSTPYTGRRFRAALVHYGLGRGLNALLSLSLFVALARSLSVRDYGAYVALWALTELLLALGNLGTEWITATEVPRLRQGNQARQLQRFILGVLGMQALSFGLIALVWWALTDWLALQLKIDGRAALPWFALLIWVEGLSRSIRDQVLSSLLLQWVGQGGQLLRNALVLAALLGSDWADRKLGLLEVARFEVGAAALALLLTSAYLMRTLAKAMPQAAELESELDWRALSQRAFHAWLGSISNLLLSAQTVLLLLARLAGPELSAVVGFARNLAEQIKRLMPIEFGFAILRTFLVARHAREASDALLLRRLDLLWLANAVLLGLALALAWSFGDPIARLVAGSEKFAGVGAWLGSWLIWVLAWSRHRSVDLAAHLRGQAVNIARYGLGLLPLVLLPAMAAGSQWPIGAVLLLALIEASYCWLLDRHSRAGVAAAGGLRVRLAALVAAWLLAWGVGLLWTQAAPAVHWLVGAGLVTLVYALSCLALRVLRRADLGAFTNSQGGLHAAA